MASRPSSQGGETRPLREWLVAQARTHAPVAPVRRAATPRMPGSEALNDLLAPGSAAALTAAAGRAAGDRPAARLSRRLDRRRAGRRPASADAAPVLDRIEPQGRGRRSAPHRCACRIRRRRQRFDDGRAGALRRNFLARAAEGEKLPVFIESQRTLPPAEGRFARRHPGRSGHRRRAVPRVRAGARARPARAAATGCSSATRTARSDFLYQLEWQDALKRGELHRLDLAFSRDQAHKVYVQDRLREHGREVYRLAGRRRAPVRLRRRHAHGARTCTPRCSTLIAATRRQVGRGRATST